MTAWRTVEESALDLYEHAPCGYLSTDPDWLILRVNQTFLEWTGYRERGARRRQALPGPADVGGRIYHETHCAPLLRMQDAIREIAGDVVLRRRAPAADAVQLGAQARRGRRAAADPHDGLRRERPAPLRAGAARARATASGLAREHTERLERLSRALVAAADTGAVARAVGEELVATFGAARTGVAVRDDGRRACAVLFGHGAHGPLPRVERAPAFEQGEPAGRASRSAPSTSSACCGSQFDEPRTFAPEERALLVACAGQATLALERSRLYEEQRDVAHVLQQSMLGGGAAARTRATRSRRSTSPPASTWRSAATGTTRSASRTGASGS